MDKKIGTVNDVSVRQESDGDIYLDPEEDREGVRVYIKLGQAYSVEDTITQLRAVCVDPRQRVIDAARAFVADDCDDSADLEAALDALGDDDDAEE